MQVSIEPLEGLQRKMTISLPAEQVDSAIDKKLKEISRNIRLDGFRPGKVPVGIVRQKYGAAVREEVIGDLIESSYREAVVKESVRPAGPPTIEPIDSEDKSSLSFAAIFEVYPEIEQVELESVEVEKPVVEITDEDLDKMIDKLREQRREWVEVDRAAQEGDQVLVDFEGRIDGETFEGGSGEDMTVELGAGRMLKEFEDGLVGMKKGEEKTVDVSFPEDYHGKEVAGKTAQFTLKVKQVSEPKLPELDADLIKSFGVESGEIEDFRNDVKANMEKELANKIKVKVKNAVMAALLEKNEVEAPSAMVAEEIRNLKLQMAQNMGQDPQKMDLDSFPDELFREEAEKRVKLGLLVGELIRSEGMQTDPDRFRETLQDLASAYEDPQQVIEYYSKNEEARTSLEGLVLEDQVVDLILDKARVSEKSYGFEEMMNQQG
jgi:trigger factor